MKPRFEILEHPSDLGIEARGMSMEDVFRNAAHGLMSVIAGKSEIASLQTRTVQISAIDRENLLVRWLSEVLYLYDAEKFLLADMRIEQLTDTNMKAAILGEPYQASKHDLKLDVKAITYHQLKVEEQKGIWTARVFIDI